MSVAALEVLALRDCLRRGRRRLAARFFRAAARVVDRAWDIVVTGDLARPEIEGPRTLKVRLINAYLPHVHAAAADDALVAQAFLRVSNLVDHPRRLLRPAVALRVVRARLQTASAGGALDEDQPSEPVGARSSARRAESHPEELRT